MYNVKSKTHYKHTNNDACNFYIAHGLTPFPCDFLAVSVTNTIWP